MNILPAAQIYIQSSVGEGGGGDLFCGVIQEEQNQSYLQTVYEKRIEKNFFLDRDKTGQLSFALFFDSPHDPVIMCM